MGSDNIYDLNDPDLQYFITNTKLDREINNKNVIYSLLNDMNYNKNYGDKKSMRNYFIKELYSRYQQSAQLPHWGNTIDNNQVRSGLNGEATRSHTNQYVFLPSDPDELVDRIKQLFINYLSMNALQQINTKT